MRGPVRQDPRTFWKEEFKRRPGERIALRNGDVLKPNERFEDPSYCARQGKKQAKNVATASFYRKGGKKARRSSGWDEFPYADSRFCAKIRLMRKTFRYRVYPTPAQERMMVQTLRECRGLYNHLLAERRDAYEKTGRSPSLYSQQGRFPELKETNPALREVHSQVLQNVAVRIDLAFKAFFRRLKAGEKPGYPRFRGPNRYDSFTYPQSGFRVSEASGRVFLSKIGHVKAVIHRPLDLLPEN